MGYESRFYIVSKGNLFLDIESDNKIWGEVIASFNMCKIGDLYARIKNFPKTNCYFYSDVESEKVIEDRYGDELIEIPINDMIAIMGEIIKEDPEYRRFKPFLSLLLGFNLNQWKDGSLVVLHYGY